ncbi:hypothetical protein ACJU26_08800 [Acidithiobacillus sp. M4-SHS-6]|uniref:hypothetical protein n=1 Tax=Acidithiobacillus sp. M4-SHS-6 TaxID=3383024 RepID=UPI0039BDC93D
MSIMLAFSVLTMFLAIGAVLSTEALSVPGNPCDVLVDTDIMNQLVEYSREYPDVAQYMNDTETSGNYITIYDAHIILKHVEDVRKQHDILCKQTHIFKQLHQD